MQPLRNRKKLFKVLLFTVLILTVLLGMALGILYNRSLKTANKIPVENFELAVRILGTGKPPLIFEGGLACHKEFYYRLQVFSSFKTKSIVYDHAGIGESTPSNNPRTLPYYVQELKEMLAHENVMPPYILVGHSLGGHIIRYFAYLYPDEVAGLIFLDHPHEDWLDYIRKTWPQDAQDEYFKFWNPKTNKIEGYSSGAKAEELTRYEENCDLIRGKKIPADIPALMFTGYNAPHFRKDPAGSKADMEAWIKMQHSIIKDVKTAEQVVYWDAGHNLHFEKFFSIEKKILDFIDICRDRLNRMKPQI